MSESYSTGRTKNFICGTDYQKLWLMLFFRRAVNRKYSFRLATEMSAVAGFDDIVFRYKQNGTTVYMLIQVKHKEDNSKKICVDDLLTRSGNLDLAKHFAAFLEIQYNKEFKDKIKDFFFVTNADLDHKSLANKNIAVETIETQNNFLNIGDGARYKLIDSGGKIAEYLKQNIGHIKAELNKKTKCNEKERKEISNEEICEGIKSFLNELVLAVNLPNDAKLEELIKDEISDELAARFRYYDENNIVFNDLFVKMSSWMKNKKGHFLTPKEGKEFFQKIELWANTFGEMALGVGRIEGKVNKIEEGVEILVNNQQARKEPIRFNMKYPVKTFTGRENELKKIHEELQNNTQAEVLQIVAISGLGGIGKSELARKYACKNKEFYGGNIIWINAEDSKIIENSFLRLASRLGISRKDKSGDDKAIETIIEEIYAFFEDIKSIFIFDNVEEYNDISKFLPFSLDHKPYILITSRDRKWEAGEEGNIEVILLDEFDEIEALEFVKKALNIQDNLQDKEVEELIRELQHFPLALGQAVAYIYNKNEESWNGEKFRISDYLKEYRQEAEKLFKKTEELLAGEKDGESRVRYAQTVLTTWNITRNRIADNKKYGKQAIDVLNIIAYLAPDDICIREIFSRLIADDEEKLKNAVKLLDRYSMINLRGKIVNIHRLVQKVTRLKLRKEEQEEGVLRKALELMNNNIAKEDISHTVSVWEYASKHGKLIYEFYCQSVYIHNEVFSRSLSASGSLHLLAQSGSYEAIEAVLTHIEKYYPDQLRAVVNVKNSSDRTPLCIAIVNGKSNAVRCLVNKGAYVNARDGYNQTPLHMAVCRGDLKIVEYLINGGGDVNAEGRNNKTPLHYSVLCCEHSDVAEYLIQRGADINARGKSGNSPLHLAATMANVAIAKMLLKHNADVNTKNNEGMTALHYATNGNHQELVELLLFHGANSILEST